MGFVKYASSDSKGASFTRSLGYAAGGALLYAGISATQVDPNVEIALTAIISKIVAGIVAYLLSLWASYTNQNTNNARLAAYKAHKV